jgi:DNA-binding transcriptional MerR regulator
LEWAPRLAWRHGRDDTGAAGLRVAELAAAVGIGADTIRFYEKTGLLLAPARTPAGYRVYEASAVHRLQFIQEPQSGERDGIS